MKKLLLLTLLFVTQVFAADELPKNTLPPLNLSGISDMNGKSVTAYVVAAAGGMNVSGSLPKIWGISGQSTPIIVKSGSVTIPRIEYRPKFRAETSSAGFASFRQANTVIFVFHGPGSSPDLYAIISAGGSEQIRPVPLSTIIARGATVLLDLSVRDVR